MSSMTASVDALWALAIGHEPLSLSFRAI